MREEKVIFSEDGSRKYVVFGSRSKIQHFGLKDLYSSEIFPFRKYFSGVHADKSFVLRAVHAHKEGSLAVFVWTAKEGN